MERVWEAVRLSIVFAFIFGLAAALILLVFADPIAGLFSDAPEIVSVTRLYLWIVPISYGGAGAIMVANAAFNGLGQPGRLLPEQELAPGHGQSRRRGEGDRDCNRQQHSEWVLGHFRTPSQSDRGT